MGESQPDGPGARVRLVPKSGDKLLSACVELSFAIELSFVLDRGSSRRWRLSAHSRAHAW